MSNTRTPSPATGSAVPAFTASPSPVGEWLTFDAFRAANLARCLKWHPAGLLSWSPSDWMTAVMGELGELASLLKMRNRERDGLRGNKFSPTDKQVADEIADVMGYFDLLAAACGVDLGRATVEKWNEVSERVGFPDRIVIAAQAPKPASAGGELIAAAKDALLECGKCFSDSDTNARHARLKAAIIAAEADAAKVKPERGSCRCLTPDNHHPDCQMADTAKPFGDMVREGMAKIDAERPAPDRLAQTVTDAEVSRALKGWSHIRVDGAKRTMTQRMRATLESFLRARESAPAQEPVAWRFRDNVEGNGWQFMIDKPDFRHSTADWYEIEPLYAAAPRAGG